MKNCRKVFQKRDGASFEQIRESKVNHVYKEIKFHIFFDMNMDDNFIRKARFIVGVNMTDLPSSIAYSIVISIDSVRIGFLLESLNNLDMCTMGIGNSYLNFECKERCGVNLDHI